MLGAAAAIAVAAIVGGWVISRPAPCHGVLTVELRPPLWQVGNYQFDLEFEQGSQGCSFEVALGSSAKQVGPSHCPFTRQLQTRSNGAVTSIVGFTLGESPSRMRLRIRHEGVSMFDTETVPKYEQSKAEAGQFCGRSAWAAPECLLGSPNCPPFAPKCQRAQDCGALEVCCASVAWGMEHGSYAASQCTPRKECDGRIATSIACGENAECDADRECRESKEGKNFFPALRTCEQRK
jgi:hypothetical protein